MIYECFAWSIIKRYYLKEIVSKMFGALRNGTSRTYKRVYGMYRKAYEPVAIACTVGTVGYSTYMGHQMLKHSLDIVHEDGMVICNTSLLGLSIYSYGMLIFILGGLNGGMFL